MGGGEVTRQREVFRDIHSDQKFHITDPLLFDCVGLGCGNVRRPNRVQGFNSDKAFGYALLTYFASIAIGFRRVPFCEDRIYTNYFGHKKDEYTDILSQLSQSRIGRIVEEVQALYAHTQASLERVDLKNVDLRREIKHLKPNAFDSSNRGSISGYAETLVMLRKSCDVLGLPNFQIEMDTLNSFGDEGAYVSEVAIELSVPAKDILYCSELIGNRSGGQRTVETGEWVVINRSPTGVVTLPTTSVIIRPEMWNYDWSITRDEAQNFIERHTPIVFRPFYKSEHSYGTHRIRPSFRHSLAEQALKFIFGRDEVPPRT
jgi:hypothetical protein